MYEEQFEGGESYTRLEKSEIKKLEGRRVKGLGKITCVECPEGELHPTVVKIGEFGNDQKILTIQELMNKDLYFDGRHQVEIIFNGGVEA